MRWVLASSVIFSHAFALTKGLGRPSMDPSVLILPFPISRLAVLLFFSLSGFLVTASLVNRGVRDFAVARALRLIPGLWVMLLVTLVVIGLFFGDLPFTTLLGRATTRLYLVRNMLMLGHAFTLDGVFPNSGMATVVNGSLWTIPQEVRCYLALALVGAFGLLGWRRTLTFAFVVAFIANVAVPVDAVAFLTEPRPLAISFFSGVLLYLWRERVFLSWPLAIAIVGMTLLLPRGAIAVAVAQLAFTYAALVVAILVPQSWKRWSAAIPDYSYGIYIYGFPAQQAAIALGIASTPYADMVAGLALALPFAALSWHLVEKPALALKPRLTRRRQLAALAT